MSIRKLPYIPQFVYLLFLEIFFNNELMTGLMNNFTISRTELIQFGNFEIVFEFPMKVLNILLDVVCRDMGN